jgi:CubicO group peptidase (beta-lactamase class C family)
MESKEGDHIRRFLEKGVRDGVYPGAVLLVAQGGEIVFLHEVGCRSLIPHTAPMKRDTIFDLASLTKPLATTLGLMKCVDEGKIDLDQPLMTLLPNGLPIDKGRLTPRLILTHSAGFADWKPFYLELVRFKLDKRKELLRKWIMEAPLVYQPGKETLYSDLGFMILEWVVERSARMPLHLFLDRHFYAPLSIKKMFLSNSESPIQLKEDQFAATEACSWRKKVIRGSVHDENAYALGGYSGHAGLFGTAEEAHVLVDFLRKHFFGERDDYLNPETVRTFFTRQDLVDGSTWALGWDSPSLLDSSSGKYFSAETVGHLGYTGTSVWMDLKQDVIVIFLTNRIHPNRKDEKIRAFRPVLHDMVMEEFR